MKKTVTGKLENDMTAGTVCNEKVFYSYRDI